MYELLCNKKTMARVLTLMLVFFLMSGCTYIKGLFGIKSDIGTKLKIGINIAIIADTQVTSQVESKNLFRSRFADQFVNVSIRTSAQETLALEHLTYMLQSINPQEADLILYLGDGANSGCNIELDPFFEALEDARKVLSKPIFFVIGNHDYLATGNQPNPTDRSDTCGGSYYTKAQLVARVSEFNYESFKENDNGVLLSYVDSLGSVQAGCNALSESQHNKGCYYSAVMNYEKDGIKGDIFLTDSSDYKSLPLKPSTLGVDYYGGRGSISWDNEGKSVPSQVEWLLAHSEKRQARVIASHYPIPYLGFILSNYVGRSGDLLLPGRHSNLWLSGHTHAADASNRVNTNTISNKNVPRKKRPATTSMTVGSTTDYRPHYALVAKKVESDFKTKNKNDIAEMLGAVKKISIRTLTDSGYAECKQKINEISGSQFNSVYAHSTVHDDLGLTGAYRAKAYDRSIAKNNLEVFLSAFDSKDREWWVRCLVYAASENEYHLDHQDYSCESTDGWEDWAP